MQAYFTQRGSVSDTTSDLPPPLLLLGGQKTCWIPQHSSYQCVFLSFSLSLFLSVPLSFSLSFLCLSLSLSVFILQRDLCDYKQKTETSCEKIPALCSAVLSLVQRAEQEQHFTTRRETLLRKIYRPQPPVTGETTFNMALMIFLKTAKSLCSVNCGFIAFLPQEVNHYSDFCGGKNALFITVKLHLFNSFESLHFSCNIFSFNFLSLFRLFHCWSRSVLLNILKNTKNKTTLYAKN